VEAQDKKWSKEKELIEIQKQEKKEKEEKEKRRKLEEEKKESEWRELFEEWYRNFEKEKQQQYQDSNWIKFQKYEDRLRKSEEGKTDQGVTSMVKPLLHVQVGLEWLNWRKGVVADGLIDEDEEVRDWRCEEGGNAYVL